MPDPLERGLAELLAAEYVELSVPPQMSAEAGGLYAAYVQISFGKGAVYFQLIDSSEGEGSCIVPEFSDTALAELSETPHIVYHLEKLHYAHITQRRYLSRNKRESIERFFSLELFDGLNEIILCASDNYVQMLMVNFRRSSDEVI